MNEIFTDPVGERDRGGITEIDGFKLPQVRFPKSSRKYDITTLHISKRISPANGQTVFIPLGAAIFKRYLMLLASSTGELQGCSSNRALTIRVCKGTIT